MPEGHTLHRLALEHRRLLVGRTLRASSPQGRFAEGAALIDGSVLRRADAYGKHLFHDYGAGRHLHVHLGLYGKFVSHAVPAPEPWGALRLRLEAPETYADLRGATACELLTRAEVRAILDRLGPDPLRRGADPEQAWRRISRSRAPVAGLLMDQSVVAGIGNVYRAELLFRHRVDPYLAGRDLPHGDLGRDVDRPGDADAGRRPVRADRHHRPRRPARRARDAREGALRVPPRGTAVPGLRHDGVDGRAPDSQPLLVPAMPAVTRDAVGHEALALATRLLQDARRADPEVGVWEAADLQWWSRRPRPSDAVPQRFWFVDDRPAAVAALTWWSHAWGLDLLVVPGSPVDADEVWEHGWQQLLALGATAVESLVRVDDAAAVRRLEAHAFGAGGGSGAVRAWTPRDTETPPVPDGYRLADRETRPGGPHPMVGRNGPEVEQRLRRCSLYRPDLDLAVVAPDGSVAGYALCWNDPVTGVGLVEPVRVEDEHSGRGVARAMVGAGLDRLTDAGARRLQIGWETERPRQLYRGLGLHDEVAQRTYRFEVGTATG